MGFTLKNVVPWGRNLSEYQRMFLLTQEDLRGRILSCGDGPASFQAEAVEAGIQVVSLDPIYQFSREGIRQRIADVRGEVMAQVRLHSTQFDWSQFKTPEQLESTRLRAMERFLDHVGSNQNPRNYVCGGYPRLPFRTASQDLALCSHFLFLYDQQFSLDFHVESILEMVRVASEARIFPTRNLSGDPSIHLEPVRSALAERGVETALNPVPYQFQRGESRMLRVWRRSEAAVTNLP